MTDREETKVSDLSSDSSSESSESTTESSSITPNSKSKPETKTDKEEILSKKVKKNFYIETTEKDKYLILYSLFKFQVVKGKSVIFVDNMRKCYHLKLFFTKFCISSLVLNEIHPKAFLQLQISKFNKGVSDIFICTIENYQTLSNDSLSPKTVINFSTKLAKMADQSLKSFQKDTFCLSFVDKSDSVERKALSKLKKKTEMEPLTLKMGDIGRFRYRVESIADSISRLSVKTEPYAEVQRDAIAKKQSQVKRFLEKNVDKLKNATQSSKRGPIDEVPFYLVPKNSSLKVRSTKNYQSHDYVNKMRVERMRRRTGNKNKKLKFNGKRRK